MEDRKKTIAFLILLGFFVIFVAGHNFNRYFIQRNYSLSVFTSCDVEKFDCFVADPEVGDPTYQSGPYSKVEIVAKFAPACLDEHTCQNFTCDGFSEGCKITYCSEDSKEEGESCSSENQ